MNNEETVAQEEEVMDGADMPGEDELVAPLDVDAEANDAGDELEDGDEEEDQDDRSGAI